MKGCHTERSHIFQTQIFIFSFNPFFFYVKRKCNSRNLFYALTINEALNENGPKKFEKEFHFDSPIILYPAVLIFLVIG